MAALHVDQRLRYDGGAVDSTVLRRRDVGHDCVDDAGISRGWEIRESFPPPTCFNLEFFNSI